MPAKNPRVNVVLERPVYEALGRLARRDQSTLSTKARDLLCQALETHEDIALAKIAEEREFATTTGISHDEVWGTTRKRRRR